MTDKRRHSIAEGFTPHSNHIKEKDKKKWSFESFSPLHFSFSRHSKSKKKSHKSHEDLTKHVDDHALETKTLSRSRWKRRASVAVVQGENLLADHAHNFEKHSDDHNDENVSIGSDSWKRRATVAALGLDNFLRDKHSSRSQQHHPSVLKLWKRKPSVHGSQQDCHLATDEDFSLVNSTPKPQLSKRRASVAVPHLHVKNHDLKVTFKTHKHRSKKSKEYFLAMVYLKDSSKRWISGEDGGGIVDLLNQATMDQRINSYRLIMASTRAILDADSCCGSPCVDPSLEDVFDELGFQMDVDGLHDPDSRFDVVNDLQKTEREYCHLVRSILDTYAEPLRKFSSLTADDHKVLFVGLEPIISISAMLTSKLEDVLKTWDSSTSQIGSLFTSKVWNLYEDYLKNYSKARKLLEDRCTADQSFLEFCNLRKEQTKNSLEKLLHLPVSIIFSLLFCKRYKFSYRHNLPFCLK